MSSHQEFRFEDDSQLLSPRSVNQLETRTIELHCASAPITQNVHILKFFLNIALWGLTIGLFFFNPIVATIFMAFAMFVTVRTKITEYVVRSSHFDFNHEGWTLRPWKGSPMSATWENTKGFEIQQKTQDYGLLTLEDMDGKKIKVQIDFAHKSDKIRDFLDVIENHVPAARYRRYVFIKNPTSKFAYASMVIPVLNGATKEVFRLFMPGDKMTPILFLCGYALIVGFFGFLVTRSNKTTNKTNEPVIANASSGIGGYFTYEIIIVAIVGLFMFIFGMLPKSDPNRSYALIVLLILVPLAAFILWKLKRFPYKKYSWNAYVTEGTLVLQKGKETIREFISDLEVSPAPKLTGSEMISVKGKIADVVLSDKTDTDHKLTELIEGIKAGKTYPPKMSALHPGFNIKYNDAEEDGTK